MAHVGISFPPEMHETTEELLDHGAVVLFSKLVYQIVPVSIRFCPGTIVTWNYLPINEDVDTNNFESIALAAIKSLQ